ncbi:hypothetical protein TYRP_020303 [Tyrophagus putrescentiae]|nr:hypothetical protein TYRP_020303 [Tyrophagus putrescentiae]
MKVIIWDEEQQRQYQQYIEQRQQQQQQQNDTQIEANLGAAKEPEAESTVHSELELPRLSFTELIGLTTTTTTTTVETTTSEAFEPSRPSTSGVSTFTPPPSSPPPTSPHRPRVIEPEESSGGLDGDDDDDDDQSLLFNGLFPSTSSKPSTSCPEVRLLPLRLGDQHMIRMPTETSLIELGLAAGSSHYAFRRPKLGELLHQHFEEIVVNGPEAERRILEKVATAGTPLTGPSLVDEDENGQLVEYRDPYYEYLDQLDREAWRRAEEEEAKMDLSITEEEQELMQRLFDAVDSTHRKLRRKALAKERARLNSLAGGDTSADGAKKKRKTPTKRGTAKMTPTGETGKGKGKASATATATETAAEEDTAAAAEKLSPAEEAPKKASEEEVDGQMLELTPKSSPTKKSRGGGGKRRKEVVAGEKPSPLRPQKKKIRQISPTKLNFNEISVKKEEEEDQVEIDKTINADLFLDNIQGGHHHQLKKENDEEDGEDNALEKEVGPVPLTDAEVEHRRRVARERKRAQSERLSREETPAEREQRLVKQRERQRRFYAKETAEQRAGGWTRSASTRFSGSEGWAWRGLGRDRAAASTPLPSSNPRRRMKNQKKEEEAVEPTMTMTMTNGGKSKKGKRGRVMKKVEELPPPLPPPPAPVVAAEEIQITPLFEEPSSEELLKMIREYAEQEAANEQNGPSMEVMEVKVTGLTQVVVMEVLVVLVVVPRTKTV